MNSDQFFDFFSTFQRRKQNAAHCYLLIAQIGTRTPYVIEDALTYAEAAEALAQTVASMLMAHWELDTGSTACAVMTQTDANGQRIELQIEMQSRAMFEAINALDFTNADNAWDYE